MKRFPVIDDALASGDPVHRRLAIDALGHGLEVWHFTRGGCSERQGSGPSLKDWAPSTRAEVVEYYRACIERLVNVACGEGESSDAAKKHLAGSIRGLIAHGQVDDVGAMADRILGSHDSHWPDAIEQTAMSLRFEGPGMAPEYRSKVEKLHKRLSPRSLKDRLRLYISEMPWGYYEEDGNVIESGDRWAKALAAECVQRRSEFLTLLPTLLTGEQRHAYALGRHIMESTDDAKQLIDLVIRALKEIPQGKRNPPLLGGMLASAETRNPAMIDRKLDAVALDPDMIHLLPWLTMQTTIELSDLERITVALRAGKILPVEVRVLAMGGVLSHLRPQSWLFSSRRSSTQEQRVIGQLWK